MVGQIPDTVDTVVCAHDDGWRYHPKHVEQFPDINKVCKVASFCIYIGTYLRRTDPRFNVFDVLFLCHTDRYGTWQGPNVRVCTRTCQAQDTRISATELCCV
jgi:hypothetical protein